MILSLMIPDPQIFPSLERGLDSLLTPSSNTSNTGFFNSLTNLSSSNSSPEIILATISPGHLLFTFSFPVSGHHIDPGVGQEHLHTLHLVGLDSKHEWCVTLITIIIFHVWIAALVAEEQLKAPHCSTLHSGMKAGPTILVTYILKAKKFSEPPFQ